MDSKGKPQSQNIPVTKQNVPWSSAGLGPDEPGEIPDCP